MRDGVITRPSSPTENSQITRRKRRFGEPLRDTVDPNGDAVSVPTVRPVQLPVLDALITYVSNSQFVQSWRIVCWAHTEYKIKLYGDALAQLNNQLAACKERLMLRIREGNVPKDEEWNVFDKDDEFISLTRNVATFEQLVHHLTVKKEALLANNSFTDFHSTTSQKLSQRVDRLLQALADIRKFSSQADVVETVAMTIFAFFQNPFFIQKKFCNFILSGSPGIGKTSIAKAMAELLTASGMYEKDFSVKSKSDFIGQYLGQTPHLTSQTLATHALDGVLFIDEAYNLCGKDPQTKRVDAYGSEFATEIVDFITRFKGVHCIIAAGYENEMYDQFLSSNDGMERRFPHRFSLQRYPPEVLSTIAGDFMQSTLKSDLSLGKDGFAAKATLADVGKQLNLQVGLLGGAVKQILGYIFNEARRIRQVSVGTASTEASKVRSASAGELLGKLIANEAGSATTMAEFVMLHHLGSGQCTLYYAIQNGLMNELTVTGQLWKYQKDRLVTPETMRLSMEMLVRQSVRSFEQGQGKQMITDLLTSFNDAVVKRPKL